MKRFVALILTTIFLTSCTAKPKNIASLPASTQTKVPVASIEAGPTHPSATPTILPMTSRTSLPTVTLEPIISTRESALDSCTGNNKNRFDKYISQAYFSSNEWSVIICQDNGIYTKVSNPNQGIVWNVPAIDDDTNSGPEWYLQPYLWSVDEKYLYLTPKCLCSIDSPWLIYSSGYGLFRLNLSTGQLDTWLKPREDGWYSFAFSKDGKLFAFSPNEFPRTIKIRDLVLGNAEDLSFKEQYSVLEYRWTPDNSRLVIVTEESAGDKSQSGFSIFVYNVKSEILEKIVNKNNLNSSFPTEEFIEPRIYISDLSNEVLFLSDIFQESDFELNIRTRKLIQVDELTNPTPTP
jgi:hypothetical protein